VDHRDDHDGEDNKYFFHNSYSGDRRLKLRSSSYENSERTATRRPRQGPA
jgi:hypothetical protein